MRVIGIIPARFASSRFPGKPLIQIKGKTMIQRVYESCMQSKQLDKVIIATDDNRIYSHLKDIQANVELTDINHLNGTERIAEVAEKYVDFDIIINIQGDEPCIHPNQIDELIHLMKSKPNLEIGTLAKAIQEEEIYQNPNAVKVHFENNIAIRFDRVMKPEENNDIGKHVGIYAFKRNVLLELVKLKPTINEKKLSLEQLRWMDNHYKIGVNLTAYESPSVDIPEDVKKVELFMTKNKLI